VVHQCHRRGPAQWGRIAENDYNLNISRYADTFVEEEPVNIPAVQKETKELDNELGKVRGKMDNYLKKLGLQ
jgi:type I restriction enzyme M protein